MGDGLRIAFLGNWGPSHSSENHEALSFEALGHHVTRIQEGETPATEVAHLAKGHDLFFWVQTYGLAVTGGTHSERAQMLADIKDMQIPTVAYHLDLWWGLDRAVQITTEPYFECDHVFSTDGGHDDLWNEAGVNHHWLPPAVFHEEAVDSLPNPRRWPGKVAFVGSWRHYGHAEHWPVRKKMLDTLNRRFSRHFMCYPRGGAVRGAELNELYATVPIIVGDSCLAGQIRGYWSDRVPETTGRGGFLIHPHVPGILNIHPSLVVYEPENWAQLVEKVEYYLDHDAARESLRRDNATWTRTHHTYRNRMQTVLEKVGLV